MAFAPMMQEQQQSVNRSQSHLMEFRHKFSHALISEIDSLGNENYALIFIVFSSIDFHLAYINQHRSFRIFFFLGFFMTFFN